VLSPDYVSRGRLKNSLTS